MAKDSTHAMAKPDAKKDEMASTPTLPVKSQDGCGQLLLSVVR